MVACTALAYGRRTTCRCDTQRSGRRSIPYSDLYCNGRRAAAGDPAMTPTKPDSHLELVLAQPGTGESELIRALLRVDLGARISVDMENLSVSIEGRFWKEDVISAIKALGCRVASVNERPRSVARPGRASMFANM